MVRNIFSALAHERTPGVIKEFVLWCLVCFSALMSLIAAAMGGGNVTWILLLLFTLGMGVLMAFRLTPVVLLYSIGTLHLFVFVIHYICFIGDYSYYGIQRSAVNTVLFVVLLLLTIAVIVCGLIQFFTRFNLGTALTVMVIMDSVFIMIFQIARYLRNIYYVSGWLGGYGGSGSYWIGTIGYWMLLTVVSLLYIFSFRGCIDNRGNNIAGRANTMEPGIRGINGTWAGQSLYLNGQTVTIGSDIGMTVVLRDSYVSEKHCAVRFNPSDGCYEIYDNSTYGVYVNAGLILKKGVWSSVKRGNVISIGSAAQRFQLL